MHVSALSPFIYFVPFVLYFFSCQYDAQDVDLLYNQLGHCKYLDLHAVPVYEWKLGTQAHESFFFYLVDCENFSSSLHQNIAISLFVF